MPLSFGLSDVYGRPGQSDERACFVQSPIPSRWPSGLKSSRPEFDSRLRRGSGGVIPETYQWLPCQASGVIRVSAGTDRPSVSIL